MRPLMRVFALSLSISMAAVASAQPVSPAAVTRSVQPPRADNTTQRGADYKFATRTLTSALAGTAGAFGLALFGASLEPDCSCDDPGLRGFLLGFTIGGATAAGIGAALPRFGGDKCSLGTRIWRGIGGAAVGSISGALVGSLVSETGIGVGWSIGTAIGGPVALIGC